MTHTVLIVDDSKLARMAVAKALSKLRPSWERLEATNSDEALSLIKQQSVNVALLDFNMPGRDGLSLAAELRDIRPEMPVAVISANVQQEVAARAQEAGAQFLQKPLSEQALAAFLIEAEKRLEAAIT